MPRHSGSCPARYRFAVILAAILSFASFVSAAETSLIARDAIWRYLDDGSVPPAAWREPLFNDAQWRSGPAQLGYGDGDEATIVNYGPDPQNKHVTTWFRHTFTTASTSSIAALTLRLIRDDGAVVYLNGTEVWRQNMPGGVITANTFAETAAGSDEGTWLEKTIDAKPLVRGLNVVAVEVHQASGDSSDLSFALELIARDATATARLLRGPYLQQGTATSIVVRWRTDVPTASRVRFGTTPALRDGVVDDAVLTRDHVVTLRNLSPSTRYHYAIGSPESELAGDATHSFVTAPPAGTAAPTRIWVLGDSGTGRSGAFAVRDAYYEYARRQGRDTNLWLMLGDNAYDAGTDEEHQRAIFDVYPEMLRSSVLWPALGNHDTGDSVLHDPNYPYYDIFTLPTRGEAGGVPSGTENYYSFDYANIHFVVLDSMTSDRSPFGPMLTWLRNDLATTRQQWIIAYWHHAPHSKGSHDSETESQMYDMRDHALPILEEAGVDLVLAGHSHSYERSFLLDGHYGAANTFVSSMKRNAGGGRPSIDGAYRKPGTSSHEGTVYVVAGSSASVSAAPLDHPAMFTSLARLGSLVLDVDGNRLDAKFLLDDGGIADAFTIEKGPAPQLPGKRRSVRR